MSAAGGKAAVRRGVAGAVCAALLVLATAGSARAQISPVGTTVELFRKYIRGVDTAYNPRTGQYLVVGGQGYVTGICTDSSGSATTSMFYIKPASGTFGAFPRAIYSPHLNSGSGAFLVVWPEEQAKTIYIKSQVVTCSGGAIGTEQILNVDASGYSHSAWLESGADIAYSTTSRRFLLVWKGWGPSGYRVKARELNEYGTAIGSIVDLSSFFGRDPAVAWNPLTNSFGVSFSGEIEPRAYAHFAVVPAGNPAGFARQTFREIVGMTTMTDIDVETASGHYLMTWFEVAGGAFNAYVAEFDSSGVRQRYGSASSTLGSYDALSMAYNRNSKTFLLVGLNRVNDQVLGLELDPHGVRLPTSTEVTLTTSQPPNWYNRVGASTCGPRWNTTFNNGVIINGKIYNFSAVSNQVVQTATTNGGGADTGVPAVDPSVDCDVPEGPVCSGTAPGPGYVCSDGAWVAPPGSGPVNTSNCTTVQPGPTWTCSNGGWLPPSVSPPSGGTPPPPTPPSTTPPPPSSSGCTTVQPGPTWTCSNGGWLPPGVSPPSGGTPPPPTPPSTTPPPSTGCAGTAPMLGWVCVGTGWVPPNHPLALRR